MSGLQPGTVVAKTSSCLRDYSVLVGRLLAVVHNVASDTGNTYETPESLMKQILEKDTELKEVLRELEEHQRRQRQIFQVEEEIVQREKVIEELAAKLRNTELILEKIVEEARSKQQAMTLANAGACLVSYSYSCYFCLLLLCINEGLTSAGARPRPVRPQDQLHHSCTSQLGPAETVGGM